MHPDPTSSQLQHKFREEKVRSTIPTLDIHLLPRIIRQSFMTSMNHNNGIKPESDSSELIPNRRSDAALSLTNLLTNDFAVLPLLAASSAALNNRQSSRPHNVGNLSNAYSTLDIEQVLGALSSRTLNSTADTSRLRTSRTATASSARAAEAARLRRLAILLQDAINVVTDNEDREERREDFDRN